MKQKITSEFIGTYFLVFAGTGAIVVNSLTNSITHVGIALTFGLVIMVSVFTFGHISGGHFNPAVTVGFLIKKEMSFKDASYYIATQIIAAITASLTIFLLFGNVASLGITMPSGSLLQSFILELIMTFFLMFVILTVTSDKKSKAFAGLAIGGTITLEALFGGPISGASMNPARSIGPAIISGNFNHLWLYIVATILGAILASLLYMIVTDKEEEEVKE